MKLNEDILKTMGIYPEDLLDWNTFYHNAEELITESLITSGMYEVIGNEPLANYFEGQAEGMERIVQMLKEPEIDEEEE